MTGAPRAQEREEEYALLVEFAERCKVEEDAARELVAMLLDLRARLEDGEALSPALLSAIHAGARTLPYACVSEDRRELDDRAAWDVAALAAEAYPNRQSGSELFADVALDRSRRARAQGDLARAQAELERALGRSPPPRARLAALEVECAELARFQRDWERARTLLGQARDLEKFTDEEERGEVGLRCALVEGRLELDLGRIERAAQNFREARDLSTGLSGPARQLVTLEEAGFLLSTERFEEALQTTEALTEDPELRPRLEGPALLRRGYARLMIGLAQGDADSVAAGEADLGAALRRELAEADRVTCDLLLAQRELARGARDGARERLEELGRLDAPGAATAFPVAERAHLEFLRSWSARSGGAGRAELEERRAHLHAAQLAQLEKWRSLPPQDDGVGFLHFRQDCEPLGELFELELALEGEARGAERALDHLAEAQAQGTLARRLGVKACASAEVRQAVGAKEILLAYFFAPEKSWLFVIDGGGGDDRGVEAHRLESRWTLFADMRRLTEAFGSSPAEQPGALRDKERIHQLARDLCRRLLPDAVLARMRGAERVTVVGEGMLGPFPFEALELDEGMHVGMACAIDHGLSLPLVVALAERRAARLPRAGAPVLAFLAPATRTGPALELSGEELAELRAAWPGLVARTGAEATAEGLLAADLAGARALLLLAHGQNDPARPLPAGIVLAGATAQSGVAEDGIVWCEDVFRLRAPELVVLGVCGAGGGHARRGEDGATHFGGAWLRAGSDCVVASPFALELDSTRTLMLELGRGLERGESVARAMRAARAVVARSWPEPFYHELLQVLGAGP